MHELEPFYGWIDEYNAEEDERSPFYGVEHSEFEFTHKIYNYLIHPQWEFFGSHTLLLKVLYADYENQFAVIEFIGEWNDCIHNDIMFLKRNVIDPMMQDGIRRFILLGENVLNFHASDDCYYEEWQEEVVEDGGWIAAVNFRDHVIDEMRQGGVHYYINFGHNLNKVYWRKFKPRQLHDLIDNLIMKALA